MVRSFPVRPPAILLLLAEGRRQRADTQWKRVVAGSAGTSSGGRALKDGRLVRVNVLQRLNDYPIPSALFAASEPRPNRMGQAGVLPGPQQSIEIRHRCRSGLGKRSALPDLVPARRLVAGSERSLATTWAQEPADRRFNTPVTQRGFNEIDPSLSATVYPTARSGRMAAYRRVDQSRCPPYRCLTHGDLSPTIGGRGSC